MTIAIDFDGTCVTHEYPKIGKDIGAVPVLQNLVENGHKLILHTMRSDETLEEAKQWFKDNGIELYGVNENPSQKRWTNSKKVYANLYIDDANLGIPLMRNIGSGRPYVDWKQVVLDLEQRGCLLSDNVGKLIQHIINVQTDLTIWQ